MHLFKDAKGREWEVVIDPVTVKRVKNILKENLYGLIEDDGQPLGDLLRDPARLVDILYVLCRDQCQKLELSDEDFGRLFDGDTLEAGSEAFMEELIDFFPKRVRESLRTLSTKGKALGMALLKKADEKLAKLDPETEAEKLMSQFEAMILKSSSGNSSASSVAVLTEP